MKSILSDPQITPARAFEWSHMSQRHKRVTRTYGGSRCHKCVRERYVVSFIAKIHLVYFARINKKHSVKCLLLNIKFYNYIMIIMNNIFMQVKLYNLILRKIFGFNNIINIVLND